MKEIIIALLATIIQELAKGLFKLIKRLIKGDIKMRVRINNEKLKDKAINGLMLKTKFLQTVSELTNDIDKDRFDKAREKIEKMSDLLNELQIAK